MTNHLDGSFKRSNVRDPRGMLCMLGRLDPADPAEILPFEREIVAPQKIADTVFGVRDPGGAVRYEQLEALARWHSREPAAIVRRAGTLLLLQELDAASLAVTVVLLSPDNMPAELPGTFTRGGEESLIRVIPRYVRLWELDGDTLAQTDRLALLPWITLMRTSEQSLEMAAARLAAAGDEELNSQFVLVGSVRYDKEYLRNLLGRFGSMFTVDLAAETPFGKELIQRGAMQGFDKGLSEGRTEGRTEGQREEAVRALRLFLEARFPALADKPEVELIGRLPDPNVVLYGVYRAPGETEAWNAITSALSSEAG